MSEWYDNYLASPEWKRKRDERRLIDGKCAVCGSPMDLNVHHLTYKNVPHEKTTDLITLCRFHHMEIESKKGQPWYDSFDTLNHMLIAQFIKEYEHLDYSAGGNRDYCNLNTVKKDLFPFMKEHGANLDMLHGTSEVLTYFRNKRYKIILDYKNHGYPIEITRTRIRCSDKMLRKAYNHPDVVEEIIKEDK